MITVQVRVKDVFGTATVYPANAAALTFVKTSNPQDEGFVVNFNDDYYLDTEHDQGTVIEISDISGPKGQFFQYIREVAADWDGSDPIRGRN